VRPPASRRTRSLESVPASEADVTILCPSAPLVFHTALSALVPKAERTHGSTPPSHEPSLYRSLYRSGVGPRALCSMELVPPLLWMRLTRSRLSLTPPSHQVLGCAIAISVLSDGVIPLWAGTLLTAADSFAFLFLEEAGVRYLELFFAALVGENQNPTPCVCVCVCENIHLHTHHAPSLFMRGKLHRSSEPLTSGLLDRASFPDSSRETLARK